MGEVITIGLDIAKSVFQVHGVDTEGAVVICKRVDFCRPALLALKHARAGIIGAASFRGLGTRCV